MQQHLKKLGFGSLCALVTVQLSGCSAAGGIKPSQAITGQFLQKMQSHQFAGAYGLLSSKCKATTNQQQLKDLWDLVEKNKGPVQSWTPRGVQAYAGTGGSSVKLGYALQCAKGSSGASFACVEENNKWLIQAFNINF